MWLGRIHLKIVILVLIDMRVDIVIGVNGCIILGRDIGIGSLEGRFSDEDKWSY